MPTARQIDENGYLHIKGCPISSYGIFQYSVAQVDPEGEMGLGDPGRIINVFRPKSAVNDPAMFESFKNMPLIDDHTMLSGFQGDEEEVAPEEKGIDGILTSNIYFDDPWLRGDLVVYARRMQKLILQGKKDLSLGYSCKFIKESGTFDGTPYEVIQIDLRGNHIALVGDGRVPGARVLDGRAFDCLSFSIHQSIKENQAMPKPAKKPVKAADSALEQIQTLLPQLQAAFEGLAQEQGGNAEGESENVENVENTGQAENQAEENGQEDAISNIENQGSEAANEGENFEASGEEQNGEQSEEQNGESQPDLPALISQFEGLLAQMKSACGQGSAQDEEENAEQQAADNVAGLTEQSIVNGAQVSTDESAGAEGDIKSPEEASKSGVKTEDAALARFYADSADKARKYDRLSKVVGAFDSSAMDARQVSAYGVKKLGIKCAPGSESIALDAYLNGVEAGLKKSAQSVQTKAADSKIGCPEIDAYLAGGK